MAPLLALVVLQAPRPVSFAEARAAAERLAGEVVVSEHKVDVAHADVDVAGALANPAVSLLSSDTTFRLSAGISVPLPLFGQRAAAVRAAQADLEVARLDVQVVRNDARWSASVAWIDLWLAQQRARVLAEAAEE